MQNAHDEHHGHFVFILKNYFNRYNLAQALASDKAS